MISYTVNFLYATEGVGKKSGNPYYGKSAVYGNGRWCYSAELHGKFIPYWGAISAG